MTHLLQRRRCLAGLGGLLVTGLGLRPALANPDVQRVSRALMGTKVDIVAQGDDPASTAVAIQAAFAEMQRLERMMSRYRADSLVSAMHRSAGRGLVQAPPELVAVLQRAAELSRLSEGAFDITVGAYHGWSFDPQDARMPAPEDLRRERRLVDFRDVLIHPATGQAGLSRPGMRIDLGGVAKLPILQAGLRVLEQHGLRHAMVNGGGDVLTRGQLLGQDWRVGLRDPRAPEKLLGVVTLRDGCVAASGGQSKMVEWLRSGGNPPPDADELTIGKPTVVSAPPGDLTPAERDEAALAWLLARTLKPMMMALEAWARVTSDSVMPPTPLIRIWAETSSVESLLSEALMASTDPCTSPLMISGNLAMPEALS